MLADNEHFLDFNRYSDLTFCFVDTNNLLYNRLRSCWSQNRIKIIDILGQYQEILDLVKNTTKQEAKFQHNIMKNKDFNAVMEVRLNGVF